MEYELILNLLSFGCGLYCLYTWVRLMREGRLFPNALLLPKGTKAEDCADEAGFIARMRLPVLALGIGTTLCGAVCLVNDAVQTPILPYPWSLIPIGVVLAVLIWYAVVSAKANREFFQG